MLIESNCLGKNISKSKELRCTLEDNSSAVWVTEVLNVTGYTFLSPGGAFVTTDPSTNSEIPIFNKFVANPGH